MKVLGGVILRDRWGQDGPLVDGWGHVEALPARQPNLKGSTPAEDVLAEIEDLLGEEDVRLGRRELSEVMAPSLRRLRYAAGLTQQELADRIGWKQPNIAALERDAAPNPTFDKLEKLAEALGTDLNSVGAALRAHGKARRP